MNASKKMGSSILLTLILIALLTACSKNDDNNNAPTVTKHWDVVLNAKFENPAPAGRSETGTASLDLLSDNTMKYTVTVTGLAAGDALTLSHIHFGDPATNGPVILNFNPTFTSGVATGTVAVRTTLADSIKAGPVYVNVHSTLFGGGLLRGQLDNPVDFAIDVPLSGANENPAVTTTATGIALLRLTANKTLYSKVTVTGLEVGDSLTLSHIHTGAVGVNGPVIQNLALGTPEFNVVKSYALSDANVTLVKTGQVYVNAHSKNHGSGIVRGQIR